METERAVLAAILLSDRVLDTYLSELGVRAEHFRDHFHAQVFQAAIDVSDEGHRPDVLTVATKLGVPSHRVDELTSDGIEVGNLRAYAEGLLETHKWKVVGEAGQLLQLASDRRESSLEDKAMELLAEPIAEDTRTYTPERLAEEKFRSLNEGITEAFPFPFHPLNHYTSGGIRRGEVTLIGGWSSHGKSIFIDQALVHMSGLGHKCHLYINEMSPAQRVDRWLAGTTGVPFYKLRSGDLDAGSLAKVIDGLNHLPFGITDVADWSAKDIARHIKQNKWDVCGVDILHLIEHQEERDIRNISRTLNQATKPSQGDCAILATVHLNENRAGHAAKRPRPSLGDIRGTGMLKNDADLVMFVHREQDTNGVPDSEGEGVIYIAKGRNAMLGGLDVRFDAKSMTFSERI